MSLHVLNLLSQRSTSNHPKLPPGCKTIDGDNQNLQNIKKTLQLALCVKLYTDIACQEPLPLQNKGLDDQQFNSIRSFSTIHDHSKHLTAEDFPPNVLKKSNMNMLKRRRRSTSKSKEKSKKKTKKSKNSKETIKTSKEKEKEKSKENKSDKKTEEPKEKEKKKSKEEEKKSNESDKKTEEPEEKEKEKSKEEEKKSHESDKKTEEPEEKEKEKSKEEEKKSHESNKNKTEELKQTRKKIRIPTDPGYGLEEMISKENKKIIRKIYNKKLEKISSSLIKREYSFLHAYIILFDPLLEEHFRRSLPSWKFDWKKGDWSPLMEVTYEQLYVANIVPAEFLLIEIRQHFERIYNGVHRYGPNINFKLMKMYPMIKLVLLHSQAWVMKNYKKPPSYEKSRQQTIAYLWCQLYSQIHQCCQHYNVTMV